MATEKRERQRANRQLKNEQQVKQQKRSKLTRRILIGLGAAIGGVALVFFLAWAFGPDDEDDAASVDFDFGTGECPPDDVTEPVREFEDAPQLCIDPEADYTARFVTDRGDIVVDLATADVPGTVNNFVTLANYRFYDDTLIFRTDPSIDIIQGGGRSNTDELGYTIPDEGSGFTYPPGLIAMANTGAPNSAGAQWFFTARAELVEPRHPRQLRRVRRDHRGPRRRPGDPRPGARRRRHADRGGRRRAGRDHPDVSSGSSPCTVGSPTSSQPPGPRRIAEPVGSSTSGVSASDSVRLRISSLHVSTPGTTAMPRSRPSPSVKAPPRWSSIGSQTAAALDPTAATSPPAATSVAECRQHGRVLERAAQVHRGVAGEVDGRRGADHVGGAVVLGVVALQDHQRVDVDLEALGPRHRRGDQRRRTLEGVGGREHHHTVGAGGGEQPAVEIVVGLERATALEGDGSAHGS